MRLRSSLVAVAGALLSLTAGAQESLWSLHVSAASFRPHPRADIEMPTGNAFPGATLNSDNENTIAIEFVRELPELGEGWRGRIVMGIPPRMHLYGAGTAQAMGEAGSVRVAPAGLVLTRDFLRTSWIRPYVGLGVSYFATFGEKDAIVSDFKVKSTWGPIVEIGAEFPTSSPRLSWFVDAKKIYAKSTATGVVPSPVGNLPVRAEARMDPLILQLGIAYRF